MTAAVPAMAGPYPRTNLAGMAATLERMKAVAERGSPG
jgi:hypothetical protein